MATNSVQGDLVSLTQNQLCNSTDRITRPASRGRSSCPPRNNPAVRRERPPVGSTTSEDLTLGQRFRGLVDRLEPAS